MIWNFHEIRSYVLCQLPNYLKYYDNLPIEFAN